MLIRTQTNVVKRIKWNQKTLQNANNLKQYRTSLCNKFHEQRIQQDIEKEWAHIKQTIIESANESIQTQNTPLRNEWWDEECKQIMTQKNEAQTKYLQATTRARQEIYEIKRTEANKVCRGKKRNWINNKIMYIEELNDKKQTRKFFR
jgi:acyl-homoserine lactone acylase PvdQ